jgi:CubicO group peptidase (beta-lactamase class C family)
MRVRIAEVGLAAALLSGVAALPHRVVAQELYFPPANGAWATVEASSVGWDPQRLQDALRVAADRSSSGVVILYRGRIMAEAYWEPKDPPALYQSMQGGKTPAGEPIEDVASAQKSIVAALVGVAVEKGIVALDDPVTQYLGVGWSDAPEPDEGRITIRHLLTMTSGLAEDLTVRAAPGTQWFYNTPAYHRLMPVLEAATGMDRDALTAAWLTRRIGMQNSSWTGREFGDPRIGWGFNTTTRDLARFGLLVLAGGTWAGEDVLGSDAYLHDMLTPSQALNPSYGFLWWLNGQASVVSSSAQATRSAGPLIPTAPADLVAMLGAQDRKVYVVPSLDLVVARIGAAGGTPGDSFNNAFWRALMLAKR